MQLKDASVLVADDEPLLCEIMAAWLAREGCRVFQADNGATALELVTANKIDLIISDVRMPVMDGITLLKKVKAGGLHTPSVIFVTGFSDIEPREAYDLGVAAFIEKPALRANLMSAVQRALTDRSELWQSSPTVKPDARVSASFECVSSAVDNGLIAFGRGGFCLDSTLPLSRGPVELALTFKSEEHTVSGQGQVRWTANGEQKVGIEITYIDDRNRDWVAGLFAWEELDSFIPRTTVVRNQLE